MRNKDLSIFEKNINRGIKKGILKITDNTNKIIYLKIGKEQKDKSYRIKPEEKVRASFFTELILDYNYPRELIDLEVKTAHREPGYICDIVIFKDKENKQSHIAIEVKKDGISQAEEDQATEQTHSYGAVLKAEFCLLVSGSTKIAYDLRKSKVFERVKNKISDIPKFEEKEPPKYIYIKSKKDLESLNKEDLIKILQKCHDTIWQGGKLAPTQAFDEVSKLLFCKIKDEKDTPNNKKYNFQIGTGENIEDVSNRVKSIYKEAKKEDEEVFKEDIKLDNFIIYSIVEKIQNINFVNTDLDTKGVAFETFMEDFFKGKMGQFFTPREVIKFCVEMLEVKNTNKILDTSCGSGGFLLACLDKVRKWTEENFDDKHAYLKWHEFAKNNLFGIEINEQIARVCKMNMIIHDDGHTNIISTNGLKKFQKYNEKFQKEKFDKILTNPPFGAIIKSAEQKEGFLDQFELAKDKKNQKTEILFIERCYEFLKPNGKMGIVLPNGILTNSSLRYVRNFIMKKFQILSIISLPQFTFTHFGAGVKSSLVFLRKKESPDEVLEKYPIFMGIAKRIGYDATGRKDKENDFKNIYQQYQNFLKDKNLINKQKLKKHRIIGGIDNYIFEKLGIKIPELKEEMCFMVYSNELENNRHDVEFHQIKYKQIQTALENGKYELKKIKEIIEYIKKGVEVGSSEYIDEGYKFLRVADFDTFQIYKDKIKFISNELFEKNKEFQPKKGEILFSKDGTIGLCKVLENDFEGIVSSGITRIKTKENIDNYFLSYLLSNKYITLLFQNLSIGQIIKHLNIDEIKHLKIPLPPLNIQKEIAEEVKKRLEKAKQLKKQAQEILEGRKKKVEKMILE